MAEGTEMKFTPLEKIGGVALLGMVLMVISIIPAIFYSITGMELFRVIALASSIPGIVLAVLFGTIYFLLSLIKGPK